MDRDLRQGSLTLKSAAPTFVSPLRLLADSFRLFGSRFDPWLRLIALATLLQHGIGVSYINFVRYSLGTWLLTFLVAAAWLQGEGLALLGKAMPGLETTWQNNALVKRLANGIDDLAGMLGVQDTRGPGRVPPALGAVRAS